MDKGLNYIPNTPRDHPVKLIQELLLFDRRIKLHNFFYSEEEEDTAYNNRTEESTHKLIKPSSGWTPQSGLDAHIDIFKDEIVKELLTHYNRPAKAIKYNLTLPERKAMKELKENKDIIIKPADKGGKIVILNRSDYILECERQLKNTEHYKILGEDPTKRFNEDIQKTLREAYYRDIITQDTMDNLIVKNPRTATFYCLPKIHKKGNPGRPIVSGIGTITEKISCFVDETIKHLSKGVNSYIKDTSHFLNIIKDITIEDQDILCTVDVSALYTNIKHSEGIQFLTSYMTQKGVDANTAVSYTHLTLPTKRIV